MLTELHTAFSREDPQAKEKKKDKVYVQHRMLEQGDRLARLLLQEGAYLYVCGDADNMARDVHQALRQLLAAHG